METDTQTIVTVIAGVLFSASEVLPFISSIKSNGILHLLANIGKAFLQKKETITILSSETRPLLSHQDDPIRVVIDFQPLNDTLDKLSSNISNSNENTIKMWQQTYYEQMSLKESEQYQLDYIIHYIKTQHPQKFLDIKFLSQNNKKILESKGYIVDYDSIKDTYKIKW
jgi:hypothetical protein